MPEKIEATGEKKVTFWVIEDFSPYRTILKKWIDATPGWSCEHAFGDTSSALEALKNQPPPNVLLLDMNLPGMNGEEALPRFFEIAPGLLVLILTGGCEEERALNALSAGAAGYLIKDGSKQAFQGRVQAALDGGAPVHPSIGKMLLRQLRRPDSQPRTEQTPKNIDLLSPREQEALRHLVAGFSKKEISDRMALSIHTVDTYIRGIYRKLEVRSATEAVSKALRDQLV